MLGLLAQIFEQTTPWNWGMIVLGILLAISELLPFTSKIKSNGVLQLILNILRKIKGGGTAS